MTDAARLAARLPEIDTVRAWSLSLAALDAVLCPDAAYRYFSFDPRWGADEQMASMRNGSGDDWSITFTSIGAFVRGFDHESALSPYTRDPVSVHPGLLDAVPAALLSAALDPAWRLDGVPGLSVSLWRLVGDPGWSHGVATHSPPAASDGSDWLFDELDGDPASYAAFAADYYEREVDLDAVEHVLSGRPIDASIAATLNAEAEWTEAAAALEQMGYPHVPEPSRAKRPRLFRRR